MEENKEVDTEKIEKKPKSKFKEIMEWVYCIIIAVILAVLFRYYIGTPTMVKMVSMYPTLEQNDRLWLNRWSRTTKYKPQPGDIITFERPVKEDYTEEEIEQSNAIAKYEEKKGFDWFVYNFLEIGKVSYIKRVIAVPGDHVEIKEGKVYINGLEKKEDYLPAGLITDIPIGMNGFTDFYVPDDCVFAMGDNRNNSKDCREFGCVPYDKIESVVAFRIWPLNKFGNVE